MNAPILRPRSGWFVPPSLTARSVDLKADLQVQTGIVNADSGASLSDVVDEQVVSIQAVFPGVMVGDLEVRLLRSDREALTRSLAFVRHGFDVEGLVAVWEQSGLCHVAVVTTELGAVSRDELDAVLSDIESSPWEIGVSLSGEEILAASAMLGLEPPPLSGGVLGSDASEELRGTVLTAARSSLWARGLLMAMAPSSEASAVARLGVDPVLAELLTLVSAAESAVFATVSGRGGTTTHLIAGSGNQRAVLTPGGLGSFRLSRVSDTRGWPTLSALVALEAAVDGISGHAIGTFTTTTEELQAAAYGSGRADLAGIQRLVGVRGLRRSAAGPQSMELAWVDAGEVGVWRVESSTSSSLALRAVTVSELCGELRDALQIISTQT